MTEVFNEIFLNNQKNPINRKIDGWKDVFKEEGISQLITECSSSATLPFQLFCFWQYVIF